MVRQDGASQIGRRPLHARNRWLHTLTYKHVFKCILDEQVIILMEHEKGTKMRVSPNASAQQFLRVLACSLFLKRRL